MEFEFEFEFWLKYRKWNGSWDLEEEVTLHVIYQQIYLECRYYENSQPNTTMDFRSTITVHKNFAM